MSIQVRQVSILANISCSAEKERALPRTESQLLRFASWLSIIKVYIVEGQAAHAPISRPLEFDQDRRSGPIATMSNSTSAFVGYPPNTQRDFYIVRGFLRGVGLGATNATLGYTRASKKPYDGYTYTSKTPGIIAGLSIVIVAIVAATGARLFLRASMSQMRFGADDWATIIAAVSNL